MNFSGEVGAFSNIVAVDLSSSTAQPDLIAKQMPLAIGGIDMLMPVTDDDLDCLDSLHALRWLRLDNARVSDKSLDRLGSIKTLQWLNLHDTQVSKEGIARLQRELPRCEIVR